MRHRHADTRVDPPGHGDVRTPIATRSGPALDTLIVSDRPGPGRMSKAWQRAGKHEAPQCVFSDWGSRERVGREKGGGGGHQRLLPEDPAQLLQRKVALARVAHLAPAGRIMAARKMPSPQKTVRLPTMAAAHLNCLAAQQNEACHFRTDRT